jgi:hypothetical protein
MTTRLSAEERRALAMLATAGCKGATQPLLSGSGFDSVTITGLVHKGLATVTPSKHGSVIKLSKSVASGSKRRSGPRWHPSVPAVGAAGSYFSTSGHAARSKRDFAPHGRGRTFRCFRAARMPATEEKGHKLRRTSALRRARPVASILQE